MLFNKNEGRVSDRVLYQTKPNMVLGCKNAIYGTVLLVVILTVSPMIIRFIGEMQVYLISQIKLPLTRYAAIAFFVIILINVVYIIWQLIGWYSMEYTLTESKIIIKSGVVSTKRNYMPYATIQDINTSQSILARLFNVGSISVFSAYDNNQLELKNISNPSEVEEIIFSKITGPRNFQAPPRSFPHHQQYADQDEFFQSGDDYLEKNEYYDEYEPITPITHEKNYPPRREYEYYPEDFTAEQNPRHRYEYEPYNNGFTNSPNAPYQENRYDRGMDEYSYSDDSYYQNNNAEDDYDERYGGNLQDSGRGEDSSERVIKRHFDKFKR